MGNSHNPARVKTEREARDAVVEEEIWELRKESAPPRIIVCLSLCVCVCVCVCVKGTGFTYIIQTPAAMLRGCMVIHIQRPEKAQAEREKEKKEPMTTCPKYWIPQDPLIRVISIR